MLRAFQTNSDNQPLRILILIGTCLFVIVYCLDSLWSSSIDVGLHYALVARIAEYWQLPSTFDPSLGLMSAYPRYAHVLAAVFGNLLGSPFAGMQFVALLALTSVWCAFAFMFSSLPPRKLWVVFTVLSALFLINQSVIHLEIFGYEIIGNFFFAHFVAQAAAIVVIAIVLTLEKKERPPIFGYCILAFSVPVIQQIHLMPALEVLGVLTLLVFINLWYVKKESRFRTFFLGLASIILCLSLTMLNPAFKTMGTLSDHNGALDLAYTRNINALALESIILIALSMLLLIHWIRLDGAQINGLALKYLGLLGIAIASLCLFQITMLKMGYGSDYAVKKYAFGLNTMLFLNLPLLLVVQFRRKLQTLHDSSQNWTATIFRHTFLGLFVFVAVLTVLPPLPKRVIAVRDVISVERYVFDYLESKSVKTPGKYDYAIGLFEDQPVFDYVITIGILKAPQSGNAVDIVSGYPPSEPDLIGRIFTKVDSKPWDISECRQSLAQDLVILDGVCAMTKLTAIQTMCQGIIDFTEQGYISPYETTGFSDPWAMGRWSVDGVATFTCKLPTKVALLPTRARISGYGFVNGYNTQRMLVSINGGASKEVFFTTEGEIKSIDIDIPPQKADILEIRFVFPDAISPRELKFNNDSRKLGAAIRTIEFISP